MNEYALPITITLRGPMLTKASGPGRFGVDAEMARDARGCPCLPHTLVRGRFRDAIMQLAQAVPSNHDLNDFIAERFGEATDEENAAKGKTNEPHRRRLHFSDFVAAGNGASQRRHRIAIHPELHSVRKGALLVTDLPFAPGADVEMTGRVSFFAASADAAKKVANVVRIGLSWITQIGAQRTIGFGRLTGIDVKEPFLVRGAQLQQPSAATLALAIEIQPRGPLCASRHKIGGNLFESEDFLPGSVLAGALAETWAAMLGQRLNGQGVKGLADEDPDRKILAGCFDQIRFRHALPVLNSAPADVRPQAVPLSMVAAGKVKGSDTYLDLTEYHAATLVENDLGLSAPIFRIDWKPKDYGAVDQKFGWALPARELIVRTAIDMTNRRAYRGEKDGGGREIGGGKLFAEEHVLPRDSDGRTIAWRTWMDLDGIKQDERAAVLRALTSLLSRLRFVSKTKAACDVKLLLGVERASVPQTLEDHVCIVLQTPALLCDPRYQPETKVRRHGALSADELRSLYKAVWEGEDFSDGALKLSHYFTSQSLAGGGYLHRRFQSGKRYRPWLLTDAGSVFVFEVCNPSASMEKLGQWLARGLPIPQWAKDEFGDSWDTNPYRPENGFGEIALHEPGSVLRTPKAAGIEIEIARS